MRTLLSSLFTFLSIATMAQEKIPLYPAGAAVTIEGFDKEPPYLEHFPARADSANGSAIVICPGGAYTMLADQHEGKDVADFFTSHGYEAFVLYYRLNNFEQKGHRFPDQYNDVTTAMRIVKSRAAEWKINPERVGILGFSAGGHLASMGTTMHLAADSKSKDPLQRVSSRPAFSILIYPVITLAGAAAHNYSREMLLGKNPDNSLVDSLSTWRRVDAHTPPVFLVYATDDNAVPPENGLMFYEALRKHNIPASLHIYDHGGHGFGMAPKDPILNTWPTLAIAWLKRMGYAIRKK